MSSLEPTLIGFQTTINYEFVCCFMQSLLSTTSFGICCNYLARYEEQGVGAQWSNFYSSPVAGDGFSLGYAIGMMMIDAVIYAVLTWYIEAVLPGKICLLQNVIFVLELWPTKYRFHGIAPRSLCVAAIFEDIQTSGLTCYIIW